MSTMDKWDTEIAPQLRAIEHCSKRVAYYARFITAAINQLDSAPDFETRARAQLEEARANLAEATARLNAASHRYHALEAAE